MKRFALIWALASLSAVSALAEPYRVVSVDRSGITVEFRMGEPTLAVIDTAGGERICRVSLPDFYPMDVPGKPVLPARRFFFAVPSREGVRIDVLDQETAHIPGVVPWSPARLVPEGAAVTATTGRSPRR